MAEKDRKIWYNVCASWECDTQTSKIISDTSSEQISLKEFLLKAKTMGYRFDIYMIYPLESCEKFKSAVVFFPQTLINNEGRKSRVINVDKTVIYQNKYYSFEEFISICPSLTKGGERIPVMKLPFYLFTMSASELSIFRKTCLRDLRNFLRKELEVIEETRGQGDKRSIIAKERDSYIQQLVERYSKDEKFSEYPLSKMISAIQSKLRVESKTRYEKLEEQEEFYCSPETTRRVINFLTKK